MMSSKLVPKLRFKEFSGEWEEKLISGILKIGSGRDYKHLNTGNIPVYGTGGYMLSVNDYLYDGESICIGRKGTINKPMFINGKFWTVDTLFYTHSFNDNIPKFIYLLFQKINWLKYNEASGVPSLSKKTIEKIKVFLPTPQEQQKIADTLSSLDNLIEANSKKVETLKEHKKGLMQQLFPADNEKMPKLRFKEFSGEWEEKRFEKIFDRIASKKYQIKSDEYLEIGKYPVVDQGKLRIIAYSNDRDKLFINNDIIVFGDHTRILKYIDFDFIVGADGTQLVKAKKEFNTKFLYYQLLKNKIPNTGYNRHFKFIKEMLFFIPTLPEQQKIADTLSSLDNLIVANSKKVEALKEHKKGLMQQIFVSEEI